jgi:ubiquinone/menaquinone biosynthesis C-methylase UbiE
MARIDVPVFWIHGSHDKWVYPGEVEDIMTIRSKAPRTVVEIPVGHNLRTSDDAKRAFRLIAAYSLQACCHQAPSEIPDRDALTVATFLAVDPPHQEILDLITAERERLQAFTERNVDEYWRNYLVGSGEQGSGYDFYKNLPEFRAFADREIALLAPGPEDQILDTGCGTGIVLEALCRNLVAGAFCGQVTALDLVPAALEKTREKIQRVAFYAGRTINTTYRAMNLEPNRLLPLARLQQDPGLGIGSLRGRIEGLTGAHVTQLESCPQAMHVILTASEQEAVRVTEGWSVPQEVKEVARELNRACGFLSGRVDGVTTDDHSFGRLNFLGATRTLGLPFAAGSFDRVISSLFISYLFNADYFIDELYRLCAPGARIVVSSMRPDSDISEIFTQYVESSGTAATDGAMAGARQMLSEAAGLFEREEEGFFKFYELDELAELVCSSGFEITHRVRSLGRPAQAVIVAAQKPL